MQADIPAITGKELIRLFKKGGFKNGRNSKHGRTMTKHIITCRTRVTFIPETRASLDRGTLMAILGPKQTKLGRRGLLELIAEYGIK